MVAAGGAILILPYQWIFTVERYRRVYCRLCRADPAGFRSVQKPQQQSGQRFVLYFRRIAV